MKFSKPDMNVCMCTMDTAAHERMCTFTLMIVRVYVYVYVYVYVHVHMHVQQHQQQRRRRSVPKAQMCEGRAFEQRCSETDATLNINIIVCAHCIWRN